MRIDAIDDNAATIDAIQDDTPMTIVCIRAKTRLRRTSLSRFHNRQAPTRRRSRPGQTAPPSQRSLAGPEAKDPISVTANPASAAPSHPASDIQRSTPASHPHHGHHPSSQPAYGRNERRGQRCERAQSPASRAGAHKIPRPTARNEGSDGKGRGAQRTMKRLRRSSARSRCRPCTR